MSAEQRFYDIMSRCTWTVVNGRHMICSCHKNKVTSVDSFTPQLKTCCELAAKGDQKSYRKCNSISLYAPTPLSVSPSNCLCTIWHVYVLTLRLHTMEAAASSRAPLPYTSNNTSLSHKHKHKLTQSVQMKYVCFLWCGTSGILVIMMRALLVQVVNHC